MAPRADWMAHHAANRRTLRHSELGSRAATDHLRTRLDASSSVLDFGCGYFDTGVALAPHVARMDGLEFDEHALTLARSRTANFASTAIFTSNADVPLCTYDLILANSVFQYFEDEAEVVRTLKCFAGWLKPGGRVLLIDLIPTSYSPWRDAMRFLWIAVRHGIPLAMMRFLWTAATSPHGLRWLRIDPPRLAELAAAAGFECTRRPQNLSPSRQRYTCELSAAHRPPV